MIIKAYYAQYLQSLTPLYGASEAEAIADIAFETILNKNKAYRFVYAEEVINEANYLLLTEALQKLLANMPIQYVLGQAWFYQLLLSVNDAVLIPRPETEELVEAILQNIQGKKNIELLDIGTGSGCIAIALKKNNPTTYITAIDISTKALALAMQNANTHQCDINFIEINILNQAEYHTLGKYDIIVSNPPYIPLQDKPLLHKNVTAYEPDLALFVPNENPLLFYVKIERFAKEHLKVGGTLFLEINENLATETAAVFNPNTFTVTIKKDMQGKERMLIIDRYQ